MRSSCESHTYYTSSLLRMRTETNGMWSLPLGPEVGCIERKNRERESARDFTAIHPPLFVVLATRDGDRQGDVLAKAD